MKNTHGSGLVGKAFLSPLVSLAASLLVSLVVTLGLGCLNLNGQFAQELFMQSASASEIILENGRRIPAEVWQLYLQSRAYLEAKNGKDAEDCLRRVLVLDPILTPAHFDLGLMLYHQRKYNEAAEHFKAVVKDAPEKIGAWSMLGISLRESGDLEGSQLAIEQYLKLAPTNPKAAQLREVLAQVKDEIKYRKQQAGSGSSNSGSPNAKAGPDNYLEAIDNKNRNRWLVSRMPIKVFIRPGASVLGFKPQYEASLLRAFQLWCAATNGKLQVVQVPSESAAEIVCYFDSNRPTTGETGHTYVNYYLGKDGEYIQKAKVQIFTRDVPGGSFQISDDYIAQVCLHEVGHALGIQGHSRVSADIMYPSFNNPQLALTKRDINTINMLYGFDQKPSGK